MDGARKICILGMAESTVERIPVHHKLPSTLDLKKARRFASKKLASCSNCKHPVRGTCTRCAVPGASGSSRDAGGIPKPNVDRPVLFSVSTVNFASEAPFPEMELRNPWSSDIIRSFWSQGFKPSSYADIFNSLPPALSSSMFRMLQATEPLRRSAENGCKQ